MWKHLPRICQWDITSKCNLKCAHCRATDSWGVIKDLGFDQVMNIFSNIISFAPDITMAIAGGEPLMRRDLREIFEKMKKKKNSLRIELLTNATLINENNIAWLCELINGFNIGLEGASKETNDLVRGTGSFEKALKGIELLVKSNQKISVRMTFFHQKEEEVEKLMRFLPSIGVNFFNFRYVVPVGRAKINKVFPKQHKRLCQKIRQLGQELDITVGFSDPFPGFLTDDSLRSELDIDQKLMEGIAVTGCSVAFNLLYIDPQGIIKACPYFPLEIADAKKGELEKIWFDNDLFNKLRRIRSFLTGRCEECKYKFACGGCRGAALAFGDIFGEDPRCWHGL